MNKKTKNSKKSSQRTVKSSAHTTTNFNKNPKKIQNSAKHSTNSKRRKNQDVYEFDAESSGNENGQGKIKSVKKRRFDPGLELNGSDSLSKYAYNPEHDDEDIDSDEAFGESDEEKFGDFKFGSSKKSTEKSDEFSESDYSEEEYSNEGTFLSETIPNNLLEKNLDKKPKVSFKDLLNEDSSNDEFRGFDEEEDRDSETNASESDEEFLNLFEKEEYQKKVEAPYVDKSQEKKSHIKLLASLGVDPNKDKPAYTIEKTEIAQESEFNLGSVTTQEQSTKIDLSDVLGSISKNKNLEAIKSKLEETDALVKTKINKLGALSAPLPKRIQEKFERSAAYEVTKKEVDEWQPIVTQNRLADHLEFPLNHKGIDPHRGAFMSNNFALTDGLEKDIDNILKKSGIEEETLKKYEELELAKENKEQAFARKAELRAVRELLFRQEQKAKRVSKIKSKTYHRILKKEKLRKKQKNEELGGLDEFSESDGEESMDKRSKDEQKRALERMTLRHKGAGKWAKSMQKFGKHNDEVRASLQEQFDQHEELKKKIEEQSEGSNNEDSDSYDGSGNGSKKSESQLALDEIDSLLSDKNDINYESNGILENSKSAGLFKMKFMQNGARLRNEEIKNQALNLRRELMEQSGELEAEENIHETSNTSGRRTFGKPILEKNNFQVKAIKSTKLPNINQSHDDGDYGDISIIGQFNKNGKDSSFINSNTNYKANSDFESPLKSKSVSGNSNENISSNPWIAGNPSASDLLIKQTFDHALNEDSKKVDKASTKLRKAKIAASNAAVLLESTKASMKFHDSKVMIDENFEKIDLSKDVLNAPKGNGKKKLKKSQLLSKGSAAEQEASKDINESKPTATSKPNNPNKPKHASASAATSVNSNNTKQISTTDNKNSNKPSPASSVKSKDSTKSPKNKKDPLSKNKASSKDKALETNKIVSSDYEYDSEEGRENDEIDPTRIFTQKEIIERAFADDAGLFEQEFRAEKKEMIERDYKDGNEFQQEMLPGWGSWSGSDKDSMKLSKFAAEKEAEKQKSLDKLAKSRKDFKLNDVIINKKKIKSTKNFTVEKLPFPFTTPAHYQNSLNIPIGSEWNTASAVSKLTKPRILTKMGKIINPITKSS
ncbi:U3 small nucleolar RNA-associated protein 14 [Smittium mucronatum]|uniref:U3 small nucleolar RNA-associated protein 14 n=1 Tax=Smittium mucronatum TaxID=133383 RepID=A0A1R0H327_9FUNG|nr:U3 small nucleolar RNA-associated protein 14 [Smittium mucronatum]